MTRKFRPERNDDVFFLRHWGLVIGHWGFSVFFFLSPFMRAIVPYLRYDNIMNHDHYQKMDERKRRYDRRVKRPQNLYVVNAPI